jgi:hypothetical protein
MRVCWARCLGNCSPKMSGEHRVSKALFDGRAIEVHGFSWCKNAPVRISVATATAKILCKTHNSALSDLDTTAGHAFRSLGEMFRLSLVRSKDRSRRWSTKHYSVDGPKLERWFLKTLVNLSLVHEYHAHRIGRDSNEPGTPSERLVKIAFGLSGFDGAAGLYAARTRVNSLTRRTQFALLRSSPLPVPSS